MYNRVICNINSEQLFWTGSKNPTFGPSNLSHTLHNTFLTQKGFTSLFGGSCLQIALKNVI